MKRDDAAIADIVAFARRAERHLRGFDEAMFANDETAQDAVIRCLGVIGEAAGRVSAETRTAHPGVPWSAIVGMRNRLVHEYGAVDSDEVYKTVAEDLPRLLEQLGPLPETEDEG
jgi:uncharacterized protein with HEPN domain